MYKNGKRLNRLLAVILMITFVIPLFFQQKIYAAEKTPCNDHRLLSSVVDEVMKEEVKEVTDKNDKSREIIIKYIDGYDTEDIKNAVKNKLSSKKLIKREIKNSQIEILKVEGNEDIETIINKLIKTGKVEYAQPNYQLELSTVASDVYLSEQ